jgi:hypothetical protein
LASNSHFGDVFPKFDWMENISARTPRKVKFRPTFSATSPLLLLFFNNLFAVYLFFGPLAAQIYGKPALAQILEVQSFNYGRGIAYSMRVEFVNAVGIIQDAGVEANRQEFAEQPVGQMVSIHYFDWIPIASRDNWDPKNLKAWAGLFVLAILGITQGAIIWRSFSRKNLLVFGRPVKAKINEVTGSKHKTLLFEYRDHGIKKYKKISARGKYPAVGEAALVFLDWDGGKMVVIDSSFEWKIVPEN